MMTLPKFATALPSNQFSKNRAFYLQYDGFYAVFCAALFAIMQSTNTPYLVNDWTAANWIIFPFACYFQILCSVFIHNASHANFPKAINRLVGEFCGLVVLTRFASWEIIHRRHHKYSDDRARDPHPVQRSYWKFTWATITNVERQLQQNFKDLFGDTPENTRFESRRALVSYATNLILIAAWYRLLGPLGFFGYFVPASIIGFLHLMHFNWTTHDATNAQQDYRPIDQDTGIYWLGNRIFFGIYNHGIHHRCTRIFNPANKREVARKLRVTAPVSSIESGIPAPAYAAASAPIPQSAHSGSNLTPMQ